MAVKLKDLLNFDIKPFLFGVLFSRIVSDEKKEIPEELYVYTAFRASKAVNFSDFSFKEYSSKLIEKYDFSSGYRNWKVKSVSDTIWEDCYEILEEVGE